MKKNFNRNPEGNNQWEARTDEEIQIIINRHPKTSDEYGNLNKSFPPNDNSIKIIKKMINEQKN